MKYLFFLAVLANIIYFLWEFNSAATKVKPVAAPLVATSGEKILLLSELPPQKPGTGSGGSDYAGFKQQLTPIQGWLDTPVMTFDGIYSSSKKIASDNDGAPSFLVEKSLARTDNKGEKTPIEP